MKVLFRTDASPSMGVGHLMRCLALAQSLVAAKHSVSFAILEASLPYCLSRQDWVGEIQIVPADLNIEHETRYLEELAQEQLYDCLVLDGYQFSPAYRHALSKSDLVLVCFDDTNQTGKLPVDMVINGAANAADLGYENTASNALLCLGEEFRILRQEFLTNEVLQKKVEWQSRHRLTLVMGGSDPLDITCKILVELQSRECRYPITIITGAAYPWSNELTLLIQQSHLQVELVENCQAMADLFLQSRLVVSAAGGTQFELLACATPAILLVVADNQVNATQQAITQTWCDSVDCRALEVNQKAVMTSVIDKIDNLFQDEAKLQNMHQRALTLQRAEGASRVVQCMSGLANK